jgi:uncharacterized membrane protein
MHGAAAGKPANIRISRAAHSTQTLYSRCIAAFTARIRRSKDDFSITRGRSISRSITAFPTIFIFVR